MAPDCLPEVGTSESERPPGPAQLRFGKYQLLARIDKGGMGEVFLALAQGAMGFNKLVVVKRLPHDKARDRGALAMFLDEARLAARLNHPNVVQTNDVGEDEDGAYYIAMEYLEGCPLVKVLRRNTAAESRAPLAFTLSVMIAALGGLAYAHELGDFDGSPLEIVHRDLSPHNIFVTYDGVVKLVDFGIAKAASASNKTEIGVIKGKLAYMAPEQMLAEPIDARTDLFVIGIVLWELIAGRPLMHGKNDAVTLTKLLHRKIPRLSEIISDVDPELDALVAKALERSCADRFASARELRTALLAYAERSGNLWRDAEIAQYVIGLFAADRDRVRTKVQECVANAMTLESTSKLPAFPSSNPNIGQSSASGPRSTMEPTTAPVAMPVISSDRPPNPATWPRSVLAALVVFVCAGLVMGITHFRSKAPHAESAAHRVPPPLAQPLDVAAPVSTIAVSADTEPLPVPIAVPSAIPIAAPPPPRFAAPAPWIGTRAPSTSPAAAPSAAAPTPPPVAPAGRAVPLPARTFNTSF